ncbi:ankyrin repeat domain-containing protein [Bacteroidota bacterium]
MKTQMNYSVKTVTMALVISLTMASCGNSQQNSVKENATLETKVKAPSMDIHTATFMGDLKAIKQHIAVGSNLNVKDAYGSTPLTIASTFGKTEVAIALMEGGADLNIKNNEGSTPLHTAAFFCRTEIVKALLEKGADKTLKNSYGSTALESVSGPYLNVKPIYEQIATQLGPLGLKLDFDRIEATRPLIAEMLK